MNNPILCNPMNTVESFWFVLTLKALSCYPNETHDVPTFTLSLDEYQMRTGDDGTIIMVILEPKSNSDDQSCKYLELNCDKDDGLDAWKESIEWVLNKHPKVCWNFNKLYIID